MLDERDATHKWREMFRGQAVTPQLISEAGDLLNAINPESPLRYRLEAELEDLRSLQQGKKPKRRKL